MSHVKNLSNLLQKLNFLRATFAGTEDQITTGVTIVCKVIKEFFEGQT